MFHVTLRFLPLRFPNSLFRGSLWPFLLLAGFAYPACQSSPPSPAPPNVLILLADDLGYGDLGCYGGTARTPHLDSLAAQGIRFTQCYAGAPNCSPSRVSLLTGRIPARAGMYSYRPARHVMHLPAEEITLAELLQEAGYQTTHIGKWHLGCLPQDSSLNQPQPHEQGFDYSLGTENNARPSHLNPVNFVRNGQPLDEQQGYACQLLADEVNRWFDTRYQADQPFFLYVAFHEPHHKVASPPALMAHYPEERPKAAEYFANVENMDAAAGRIFARLRSLGLDEKTVIFFASDNGPYRMGSQGGLRGLKGEIYEGGIRVPGIWRFPGQGGGQDEDTPIWFQDVLPTVCDLAGINPPTDRPLDGQSLLPLLQGEGAGERERPMLWFFYRSSPELAFRQGDYSLIGRVNDTVPRTHGVVDKDMPFIKSLYPDQFELYDLRNDPGQQHDLSGRRPEVLEALKASFRPYFEAVRAEGPAWEGLPTYEPEHANHHKPTEYARNRERFLE